MIITIDGPAGSGKSTAARGLAEVLGFEFLDTGAMYRAVTFAVIEQGIDPTDAERCQSVAERIEIRLDGQQVLIDRIDCTDEIRRPQVTDASRYIAAHPGVRRRLVQLQREAAQGKNVVTEGRDQGSVVFPDARCKFFIDADSSERARRRQCELAKRGHQLPIQVVLAEQEDRDARDRNRDVGPLISAEDAVRVDTTELSPREVMVLLERHVRAAMSEER